MGILPIWTTSMPNNAELSGCPVCGYAGFLAFDDNGLTTYDICPCCLNQSGYDYGEGAGEERFIFLRRIWFNDQGARWLGSAEMPNNWNALIQLEGANLSI